MARESLVRKQARMKGIYVRSELVTSVESEKYGDYQGHKGRISRGYRI